jgi:hypothetical protein
LQVEDYIQGTRSLRNVDVISKRAHSQGFISVKDLPIKILDRLIDREERTNEGFSLYQRGDNLRKNLIDKSRV